MFDLKNADIISETSTLLWHGGREEADYCNEGLFVVCMDSTTKQNPSIPRKNT